VFAASQLADEDSNIPLYFALRASDRFVGIHNRIPGDDPNQDDALELKSIVQNLLKELNINFDLAVEYCQEM
jgi:hypothetical protein